jgi:hypothetical protein
LCPRLPTLYSTVHSMDTAHSTATNSGATANSSAGRPLDCPSAYTRPQTSGETMAVSEFMFEIAACGHIES